MSKYKLEIIAALVVLIIVIIIVLVRNAKKAKLKDAMDDINVRFNEVKSSPIAYKLSKAQSIARRNDDDAEEIRSFYDKYDGVQKQLDEVQTKIEELEDDVALKKTKDVENRMKIINEAIKDIQHDIKDINVFLDKVTKEENNQRSRSLELKKLFQEIKVYVGENAGSFKYAIDGIDKKIEIVENLFSESEDLLYAGDFVNVKEVFDNIEEELDNLQDIFKKLPELIKGVKGTIPTLLEEVDREYSFTRQRGINLRKYAIDTKVDFVKERLSNDLKSMLVCQLDEIKEHCEESQEVLRVILNDIDKENAAYDNVKQLIQELTQSIIESKEYSSFIEQETKKHTERFGMEDLKPYLNEVNTKIKAFEKKAQAADADLCEVKRSPLEIQQDINEIYSEMEVIKKSLLNYRLKIVQISKDEQRAISEFNKLQLILNEIDITLRKNRIPTIADAYYADLKESRENITEIKKELEKDKVDVEQLNKIVDEAVNKVSLLYNNANNIAGMAMMIENAIVFGNKFRSTYKEVDQELSKAEFCYINGEYTKSLTTAIKCLEKLFPQISDKKVLEND